MEIDLQPKQLAQAAGISPSHASNILSGTRGASAEIALAAFRVFGVRLGLLADMTNDDIAKLAAQMATPPECQGCDASASAGDDVIHNAPSTEAAALLSTGQTTDMSQQENV